MHVPPGPSWIKLIFDGSKEEMGQMRQELSSESTPRGGVNRCKANLMTNDVKLKINCNTLSVTKECSEFPVKGSGLSPLNSSK